MHLGKLFFSYVSLIFGIVSHICNYQNNLKNSWNIIYTSTRCTYQLLTWLFYPYKYEYFSPHKIIKISNKNPYIIKLNNIRKMSLVPKKKTLNCPFLCPSFPFSSEYPGSSRERGRTAERSSCVPDFFSGPRKQSCATLHMQTRAPNVVYVEQKVSVGSHGDFEVLRCHGGEGGGETRILSHFR